ncbi:MAG TPA: hypothetical protein VG826_20195 [Pirellulales bacterium]|nr:hypothetical protein [Pirellulales bacterium]
MKTISVHCHECGEHFFVELAGDPQEPEFCSDIVAEREECPHCGTIQEVTGGWVEGKNGMQYFGQPVGEDEDDGE